MPTSAVIHLRTAPGESKRRWWPEHRAQAVAGLAIVLTAAGARWIATTRSRELRSVESLLAEAYTKRRAFEWRLPAASYAPVASRQDNDKSGFSRPIALLEAESRIAQRLAANPDDSEWLRLRARAEMVGGAPETAIATLTRALDFRPDDPVTTAYLGTAYALRAVTEKRAVDFSAAIEYLTQALLVRPDFPEAVFNRAIVYEQMYMYEDAIREWDRYLSMDTRGGWAEEARSRMAELKRKKNVREVALSRISSDSARFLEILSSGQAVEPEHYLEIAIIDWLPRRWDDARTDQALHALARLFQTGHRDPWLRDVLASGKSDRLVRGFAALAEAVRANRVSETAKAIASASEAAAVFRSAGNAAGALRAKAERVYALRFGARPSECKDEASAAEREARAQGYVWILGDLLIELGTCRGMGGDRGGSVRDTNRAVVITRDANYPVLGLRATGILAGTQTGAGNLLAAWDPGREGLSRYWTGPYPGYRAYQIYFNFGRAAENLGRLQAAYAFGRAGIEAISGTSDRLTEATGRYRVARWAKVAGWPHEAAAEYQKAAILFSKVEQTKTVRELRMYAEVFRAEAEIAEGAVERALQRLNALGEHVLSMEYEVAQMRYHQAVGDADWRAGRYVEAESAYRAAVSLGVRRSESFQDFEQRSASVEAIGKAYRGLAELRWTRDKDIGAALRLWETFRSGEWPRLRDEPDLEQRLRELRRETFVSYAVLPGGIVMWVFDDRGIEGVRLAVRPEELEKTAQRFVRLCADPTSDQAALVRDGRQLYTWLIAPLAHRLDPARVLVIEPDGPVSAIPMQALVNGNSQYLGEQFAVVVARGVGDYLRRSASAPVNGSAKALVMANPALDKQAARAFPPLPQALREGESIAARFRLSVKLAQEEATFTALERHRPDAEVFHFAGHSFSNAGNGGLLLAPGGNGAIAAEVLDGKRLAGQNWRRCRLAVLSACSSGAGETRGPVNPESLVRRLLWAGAARVVASRWNSDSETAVQLMDELYTGLFSGLNVPEALRRSAERIRQHRASNHPYYWAGFQTFGSR